MPDAPPIPVRAAPGPERTQTASEELANALTHGIGLALSIAALVLVVVFAALRRNAWSVVGCSIYGATLVLLYAASTFYHAVGHARAKRVFNVIDHSSIYLLVAGTYTPFLLGPLRGALGWSVFGVVWGLAAAGIVFQSLFIHRYRALSVASYLALGWMVVLVLPALARALPPWGVGWIALGGLCYTAGVGFYAWKSRRFAHAVWHVFVLAGSLCHFFGVLFFVARR
jgi:hemolysin III